jgi:hypothetical protein
MNYLGIVNKYSLFYLFQLLYLLNVDINILYKMLLKVISLSIKTG